MTEFVEVKQHWLRKSLIQWETRTRPVSIQIPLELFPRIWMLRDRVFLMKGITETLIMVFTDVQRFVDSDNEMEQFKQAEYYMNEGKEEIMIHSSGLRTRQ